MSLTYFDSTNFSKVILLVFIFIIQVIGMLPCLQCKQEAILSMELYLYITCLIFPINSSLSRQFRKCWQSIKNWRGKRETSMHLHLYPFRSWPFSFYVLYIYATWTSSIDYKMWRLIWLDWLSGPSMLSVSEIVQHFERGRETKIVTAMTHDHSGGHIWNDKGGRLCC